MKKKLLRKQFRMLQINERNGGKNKYIKDKGLKKFLLQHMKKQKLDFSKVKIPSFFGQPDDDEKSFNESFDVQGTVPIFQFSTIFPART